MFAQQPRSFDEFWVYYVGAHRNALNRALHYVGSACGVACVVTSIACMNPAWLLAAPLLGYGPSWFGHFAIERNRPATFGHALYSLRADFKMIRLALQGKMADEVTRLFGDGETAPASTPLSTLR